MLNRKVIIVIFLVSFLAIGAVSASEGADNSLNSDLSDTSVSDVDAGQTVDDLNENTQISDVEDDVLSSADDEDVLSSDNGTFFDLKSKIDSAIIGSTIELDRNYVYGGGVGRNGISITNSLTIDGNGHTLDARGQSRIFDIGFALMPKVTLKNINFVNANADDNGGAICAGICSLEIINCTFTNNIADGGGAICSAFGVLNIRDSTFTDNGAAGFGGAILTAATSTITNSTFTGNYIFRIATSGGNISTPTHLQNSESKGGAIYTMNQLTVTDSLFEDNFAEAGGAIYDHEITLDVVNSVLNNNTAIWGGAILGFKSTISVTDSKFANNRAVAGGAVTGVEGTSKIFGSSFEGNQAGDGGALYGLDDELTVSDSTFTENIADYGGAIQINSTASTVAGSTFSNNRAGTGAAIFAYNAPLTVSDSLLTNNDGESAAIVNMFDDLTVSGSNFTDNDGKFGGAIQNWFATLKVTDSQFSNNTGLNGGAICISGSKSTIDPYENGTVPIENIPFEASISNCAFNGNAAEAGGAIFNDGGGLKLINSSLDNNRATKFGGAVYNRDYLIVMGTALSNNQAEISGGAIDSRVKLRLEKSSLTGNRARFGGAVNNEGTSTIIDSNFTGNLAEGLETSAGGAVYTKYNNATDSDSTLKMEIIGDVFINNTADIGGAVYVLNSSTVISDSLFVENSAKIGSAVASPSASMLSFGKNISLIDNANNINSIYPYSTYDLSNFNIVTTISFEIGHIDDLIKGSPTTINVTANTKNNKIEGNLVMNIGDKKYIVTFTDGVGVFGPQVLDLDTGKYVASINFNQTYFTPASAQSNEFIIMAKNSFLALSNEINNAQGSITLNDDYVFDPNTDSQFKDGIVIEKDLTINGNGKSINANKEARIFKVTGNAHLTIKDATLLNGKAEKGGAVVVEGATLTVENSQLTANQANEGGAIDNNGGSLTIANSKLSNNTASDNGGAVSNKGNLSVVGCELTSNQANDGGAIDNNKGTMTVVNSKLSNNTASDNGGAVSNGGNLSVVGCELTSNHASEGGVIDNNGGSVEIADSKIRDNTAQNASAISTDNGASVSISNTKFIDNGDNPISSQKGTVNITESKFVSKVAFKIDHITDSVSGSDIVVKVTETTKNNKFNGNVTVFVGNEEYAIEIINGTGSKVISLDLSAGSYNVKLSFNGTDEYDNATAQSNAFTVAANPTTLSSKDVTTVYNGGKYLYVNLTDSFGKAIKGAVITVKLSNGKTFTPKTNENGQVKVSTDNLVPNIYDAVITFDGDGKYIKSNATAKITVKKATPKLTAKAKTFKRSVKAKKYTVTLKTNRNKVMKNTKVTVKVNKKTYAAKTNSKGVATFNLNKLTKKGKYTATIKYVGSKYYNAKAIKVKVTIK